MAETNIESVLKEERLFQPPPDFSRQAHIHSLDEYERLYQESITNPEAFWARMAEELHWFKKWDKVMEWEAPFAKFFVGGTTNVSYNCLDRHLTSWKKNRAALIWEGEPGDSRVLTYQMLHREVCKFANVLKHLGIQSGDRVAIYLPMIPELPIAMLACARLGAIHSVVFGGFSAEALRDRINDSSAKLVITADGGYRRGNVIPLKVNTDAAVSQTPSVENMVVVQRCNNAIHMEPGRDHWWHELMSNASDKCEAVALDSEHPLYILYTSGTTGKPKGVLHSTAGYMLYTYLTAKWVFDLKDEDTYWCTADIGWVTGHSYIVYGPLANGTTSVMYEGAPNFPDNDRFWAIVEKYAVNVFYTAPTAIRTFMRWGEQYPDRHNLSSLRLLGTVGEPINPEAWMWYARVIGKGHCPIVDTWWQTETGGILITPLPGATPTKPGSATRPFFGIVPEIVNQQGEVVPPNTGGFLVLRKPWPSMLRTIYGDPERFKQQYWSQIPGSYFTGDGARQDQDGYFWIMGRIDDVVNVAGHRLGTAEVESALVSHLKVAEAAVVGVPDAIKGESIAAFVTLKGGEDPTSALRDELKQHVVTAIGALARPDQIRFTDALPKTRSGKIMRRLLRELASSGEVRGDTTTLEDIAVLAALRESEEE
ncbi:MAG: acetate--CoA ligase [Candidatus Tectimicrobiota bacterium]